MRIAGMLALLCLAVAMVGGAGQTSAPGTRPSADLSGLFAEPVALCDADGKVIVTRRALGHPVVADFDADGVNDVLLGCHAGMDTTRAEILVLRNVGSNARPLFRWPAEKRIALEEARWSDQCSCKSADAFEIHPLDYDGDGHFDLLVDTMSPSEGVSILLNTGESRTDPTFAKGAKLHAISSHGKGSGGGDWDNDGVPDLVFPVNTGEWSVHRGVRGAKGELTFEQRPAFSHDKFRMAGQERWFAHTPYAYNFSGRTLRGSPVTEIVAVEEVGEQSRINYYHLDRGKGVCTLVGTLAVNPAVPTRLSVGDLNADGCMDVLYTGGVFGGGAETKIYVLYGKVRNVPPAQAPATAPAGQALP